LLAPVEYFTGVDIAALKLVGIVCLGASLAVMLLLFTRLTSLPVATITVLAVALHPKFWAYTEYIQSEPPFILSSFAVLLLSESRPSPERRLAYFANALLVGLLLYFSISCRSIGIATLGAVVLHEGFGTRLRRPWVWVVVAVAVAGILIQGQLLGSANYSEELSQRSVTRVIQNIGGYWQAIGFLFVLPRLFGLLSPAVLLGLGGYGLWRFMRREVAARAQAGLLDHLRAIPLVAWFAFCQLGALVLLPFAPSNRYLIPLLPVLLLFFVAGLSHVLQLLPRWRIPATRAVFVLIPAYYLSMWAHFVMQPHTDGALCADCMALYEAVRTQTGDDERIAFAKPRALALLTRRPSWGWAVNRPAEYTARELTDARIRYLITVKPDHELAEYYPPSLSWEGWRSQPHATLIYENSTFRLIRLGGATPS
jgi:uncharacterized membrane protein YphA (DoxX/SURF4 family)